MTEYEGQYSNRDSHLFKFLYGKAMNKKNRTYIYKYITFFKNICICVRVCVYMHVCVCVCLTCIYIYIHIPEMPMPVVERSKVRIFGSSLAGSTDFYTRRRHGCLYFGSAVCC